MSVDKEVLEFYKTLPFNYYGSLDAQVKSVLKMGHVVIEKKYPPLKGLITPSKRILEVGCGAGWLTNSIAYNYKRNVLGIDFNPHALERARAVATKLDLKVEFECKDIFDYSGEQRPEMERFDLIISLGVLHHTKNCMEAMKLVINNLLGKSGYFFVGLYHQHGREPFLKYFEEMKKANMSEENMFLKYKELHSLKDEGHLESWFRDQVLHPHETLHTIEEIINFLPEVDGHLVSTSINKFSKIVSTQSLVEEEKTYRQVAEQRLKELKYFPGFFVFLIQKI